MKTMNFFGKMIFLALMMSLITIRTEAQNLDVPYVPTPQEVVEKMLDVTNVGPDDYVIDLGSGDGRIVIAAAKRGARGVGIDLNPQRVKEANENAREAGVTDKVKFIEGNIFDFDVSEATVVTMYLLSSVNLRMRPVLLENLKPGTRVVSHAFSMGEWEADEHIIVDNRHIYYWVVPASVEGTWEWTLNGKKYTMNASQEFQKIDLSLNAGNSRLNIEQAELVGDSISFSVVDVQNGDKVEFVGTVDNNQISGVAQIENTHTKTTENWTATLRRR
jgi:SAM-dependent methyltransferase